MNAYPVADEVAPAPAGANRIVDLRSDTVTRPTAGMYDAMRNAPLGDDVYGDDPTVNQLQEKVAGLLGKEAALLFPSGTQSNLAAVMSHCGRGEEIIIGRGYHIVTYEAMGSAVLGSVAANVLPTNEDGQIPVDVIRSAVRPDDAHFPVTRLLSLENTHNGRVIPLTYVAEAAAAAREVGLNVHLDGARMMNAAVALGVPPASVVADIDTVSLCLSKGLGTPAGSVLAGPADFIARARRVRKMLGGGLRQAGLLAACGIYALDNHVARLAEDHARAAQLADGLSTLSDAGVTVSTVNTNMVYIDVDARHRNGLQHRLAERGVQISGRSGAIRLVVHLDVTDDDVEQVVDAFGYACGASQSL